MKKLEINQLETTSGGDQCGMDIAVSIIFGGMLGLGPLGIGLAIFGNIARNPHCMSW